MKRIAQIFLGLFLLSSVIFFGNFITTKETKAEQGFSYVANQKYDATSDYFVCGLEDESISGLPVSKYFYAAEKAIDIEVETDKPFIYLSSPCGGTNTNKAFVVRFANPIPSKRFKTIVLSFAYPGSVKPDLNVYNINEISDGSLGDIKETITVSGGEFRDRTLSSELYADSDGYVRSIVFARDPANKPVQNICINGLELRDEQPEEVPVYVDKGDILPDKPTDCGGLFLGWELNGNLYKAKTVSPESGEINALVADFKTDKGASIRLKPTLEETGVRFAAIFDESSFLQCEKYIEEIGVIVMPTDLIGNEDFTDESSGKPAIFLLKRDDELAFNDGKLILRATIKSIKETNYGRYYSARAFLTVKYGDGTTERIFCDYDENYNSRSVYYVATKAYLDEKTDETQKKILSEYLSKVADITVDLTNYTANATETETGINAADSVTLAASDENTITLEIVAYTPFSLIINGKEIREENIISETRTDDRFTIVIRKSVL